MKKNILILASLNASVSAFAQFVEVDTFDSYTAGSSASAQSANWTTTGGSNTVVDFSGNNAITVDANGDGVRYNNGSVFSTPNNSLSTTFFQVYLASDADGSSAQDFRILDTDSTSQDGSQAGVRFRVTSGGTAIQTLLRTGSNDVEVELNDARISFDTLYNAWVVTNTTSDTYSLYMSTGTDAAVGMERVGQSTIASEAFQSAQTGSLDRIYLRNSSGNSTGGSYFDNIYFDASGSNLANPVPEPSAYGLIAGALALSWVMIRRRA